jgi:hypothetical protein
LNGAVEIGLHRPRRVPVRAAAPEITKNVLNDILGDRRAFYVLLGVGVEPVHVGVEELLEGASVARSDPPCPPPVALLLRLVRHGWPPVWRQMRGVL